MKSQNSKFLARPQRLSKLAMASAACLIVGSWPFVAIFLGLFWNHSSTSRIQAKTLKECKVLKISDEESCEKELKTILSQYKITDSLKVKSETAIQNNTSTGIDSATLASDGHTSPVFSEGYTGKTGGISQYVISNIKAVLGTAMINLPGYRSLFSVNLFNYRVSPMYVLNTPNMIKKLVYSFVYNSGAKTLASLDNTTTKLTIDATGYVPFDTTSSIRGGTNPDKRYVFIKNIQNNGDEVVLTFHGWLNNVISVNDDDYSNLDYMEPYAKSLASNPRYKNNSIFAVDWKEASGFEVLGSTLSKEEKLRLSVENAALWVMPVASEVANHIKTSNIDPNKISLHCHSLGAYLCQGVALYLQKDYPGVKVNSMLLLDPAEELKGSRYDLNLKEAGRQSIDNLNCKELAANCLSIVGINSSAGNKASSEKSHISLLGDFGNNNKFFEPGSDLAKAEDMANGALDNEKLEHTRVVKLANEAYSKDIQIPVEGKDILNIDNAAAIEKDVSKYPKFTDKTTGTGHTAILVAKETEIVNNQIKNVDDNTNKPKGVIFKGANSSAKQTGACSNLSSNDIYYDSNESNYVQSYKLSRKEHPGCDRLKADGGNDILKAADEGHTILEGESGDDVFDLTYNASIHTSAEITDFGDGEDILMLAKKYKGGYTPIPKKDGSVDIEVLRDDVGDFQIVANIKGPKAKELLNWNNFKDLSKYYEAK